ncbi:MAG: molecular chaperone DnaK [Timaviella obliquedivisa GSE-PSE-MK23-08B]|jgi:molecular chaperone DnaK|nr:molecular chaperone DnaK [Timaviella obliquedivisa GSE-PSE-MK23-08B]
MGKVVGIDLGTTNSVVAVMEGGKPIVIANAEGMRTTPSVVAFTKEEERLVGQMARRQAVLNPQNTFYGVKRYIGRLYEDITPESKRVPYTIRMDEYGNIKVKCPRMRKEYAPEEISAMVLRKLAEEAERYLGEPITGAVITVPAYFDDAQRQATRDAGRIAGLEVLRILNEPTAASLAYGLDRRESQMILVYDLGGGTFDVSVMDIGDGVFEVRSTSGDTQLGGVDFDNKIVDWLADQFFEQEGVDLRRDRQSLQRLMEAAEKAKIELSGVAVTEISLPFIAATEDGPKHLETRLTRSQFEGLCGDLINRLRRPVKQALDDAGVSPAQIDEVVLVGGSTRIPMIKQLVRSLIDREPNENVNPDEVVAVGAAIQAAILNQEVKDILLLDVTPLSLGLETIGGVMKKLIPRNTAIPVRRSDVFSTSENNQTMVEVHVVQGEREMAADNKSLGRFKLMGIPPAPRGIPQVQVSLDIDANGILQVTALDRTTGREQGVTIQGASTLSDAEVDRMIQEAELYADQDRQKRDRIEKRTKAEALTFEAERQLREVALDFGMQFASSYRRKIENLVQELRAFLSKNDDRGIDITQGDLRDALYDLQQEVYSLTREDEDEGDFFGSIRRTLSSIGEDFFSDDDDRDYYDNRRDPYGRDSYLDRRDSYGGSAYGTRPNRDFYSPEPSSRDPYSRDSYDRRPQDDWDNSKPYGNANRELYDASDRSSFAPRDDRDSYGNRETRGNGDRDPYANQRDDVPRDRVSRNSFPGDNTLRDNTPRDSTPRDNRNSRNSEQDGYEVRNAYEDQNDSNDRQPYSRDRQTPAERNERNAPQVTPKSSRNLGADGNRGDYSNGDRRPPSSDRRLPSSESRPDRYTNTDDEWGDDDEWL